MPILTDIEYGTTLVATTCGVCHVPFGLPDQMMRARQKDGRDFWCPNGHAIHYYETENKKLQKALDVERERLRFAQDEASRQREHRQAAERKARALKGVVTKTKKRIAAGKCVRCSCEFPNLAAHMAEEHPDYDPAV